MKAPAPFLRTKSAARAALALASAALLFLLSSFLIPALVTANHEQRSLNLLSHQAGRIQTRFQAVLKSMEQNQKLLDEIPLGGTPEEVFSRLKRIRIDPETEGICLFDGNWHLKLWTGSVLDLSAQAGDLENLVRRKGAAFLVRHKASVHLIMFRTANDGQVLAHFKALAFIPQFQSYYISDYHFLPAALQRNCDINYWSYWEDVSVFEKIFSRHGDQYTGQPRQKDGVQTVFFPLRGRDNTILATVSLSSPPLTERSAARRESCLLAFYMLAAAALAAALIAACQALRGDAGKSSPAAWLIPAILIVLRLIFFPLSRLGKVQSLSIFSPARASFLFPADLTKSPADIFLTSLLIFLLAAFGALRSRRIWDRPAGRRPKAVSYGIGLTALTFSGLLVVVFQRALEVLIANSSVNLLKISLSPAFILLHLAVVLFGASIWLAASAVLRAACRSMSRVLFFPALILVGIGVLEVLRAGAASPGFLAFQFLFLFLCWPPARFPGLLKKKEALFLLFSLGVLYMAASIEHHTALRTRSLLESYLKNSILSQEQWGNLFLEQSFPEIDKKRRAILSYLNNPDGTDMARGIWERTLIAKFNWYSSLEVLDAEGNVLSRFSLNVPKFYGQEADLPVSPDWSIVQKTLSFLGRERSYLVGYRDFAEDGVPMGRLVVRLSVDAENLPFLYSANPYFELVRASPLPSLNQYEFGTVIYSAEGRILFNPQNISAGVPAKVLDLLKTPGNTVWADFRDRQKAYHGCYFHERRRIFSIFMPKTEFRTYALQFLKLFFYDLILLLALSVPYVLLAKRRNLRKFFWSFSNRVYLSFLAIALIPMLLFAFFTRNLFDSIFARRFTEEAATHGSFARSVMEDFLLMQPADQETPLGPTEDLVLWISSTIGNDVNLYQEGRLVASSRREFFDSGLFPDLLDGDVYFKILFARSPYITQRQSVGHFSFQILTIPYYFQDSAFFISIPFPFEKQEVARATRDLVEFLLFLSAFFMAAVVVFARGIREMIITPVRKLLAGTHEVGLGNLEVSIQHKSQDEMRTLVEGFNTMIQSLKAHQQDLAEMGKKAAWAEMARKVAHDIKNPLTPIQLSAEHLLRVYEDRRGDFDKALKESTAYIISEVENLRRIAQEFMEISRETSLIKEPVDVKDILEETLQPYKKLLAGRIRFQEVFEGDDFSSRGDASKLKTAFRNILINAIEAIGPKGQIKIHAVRLKERMRVTIEDTGPGMDVETLNKIFEPYYSTKPIGTGLGLPIAKKIIEEHGGAIQISSAPGKGTCVEIGLPWFPAVRRETTAE